jgi:hypothetical protein
MPGATAWLTTTWIPVVAESPVAPLATMVWLPGVVPVGIVTGVENEPDPFVDVEPIGTEWLKSVRRIVSSGAKFWPFTVKDPPGAEIPELVVIKAAWGPSRGRAKALTCEPSPISTLAVTQAAMTLRLIATILTTYPT